MKSFHRRTARPAPQPVARPRPAHGGQPRADQLLVEKGLAPSRTAAQRLIADGRVSWLGERGWLPVGKPAETLPAEAELRVAEDASDRYVSRGGLKLAGALAHTGLSVAGFTCLDVGQSTGGFSDCLLQAGAAKVVGVDVGHGQLHPRLSGNTRLVCIEGCNARHLCPGDLAQHLPPTGFDLIVGDLSFISLSLVLPQLPPLLAPAGALLMLVKPQFEVGPEGVGKGGIVQDPALYAVVDAKVRAAATGCGLAVQDYFDSPITGGDGNREFFMFARHAPAPARS